MNLLAKKLDTFMLQKITTNNLEACLFGQAKSCNLPSKYFQTNIK